METQEAEFCVCSTEIYTKLFFKPKLPLIPKVGPSPCIKKIISAIVIMR